MAVPAVIGVYVRQAGVWERANAGTPEGFSGPQVYQTGWKNCVEVRAKASSVWQYSWVNIDGEINLSAQSAVAEEISVGPTWFIEGGFQFQNDGEIFRQQNPGTPNETVWTYRANWRNYDCGRDYEIKFERSSGIPADTEPGLDTWLNFTNPASGPYEVYESESGVTDETYIFGNVYNVRIREKVSAPAAGNDNALFTITLTVQP